MVADTEASLGFYRDALGLEVVGNSENWGLEQEHLNNVFGARLRITTLRAGSTPGVELHEYLAPGDGRPYPSDARSNDILHWQTNMVVQDPTALEGARQRLLGARGSLVSPGVVAVRGHPFGLERALLVRDPDGHAVRLAVEAVGAD